MSPDETEAISWLPRLSLGLTVARLSERLRCPIAAVQFSPSSRGEWKTCSASRLVGEHKPRVSVSFDMQKGCAFWSLSMPARNITQ